jgi:hypothetical protein
MPLLLSISYENVQQSRLISHQRLGGTEFLCSVSGRVTGHSGGLCRYSLWLRLPSQTHSYGHIMAAEVVPCDNGIPRRTPCNSILYSCCPHSYILVLRHSIPLDDVEIRGEQTRMNSFGARYGTL